MSSVHPYERLFLLKDGRQDIYVDLYRPLPQHQIEGLRFLYRQFKKKTPGVILNDPSGYGKSVQTVLFLQAIRSLLDKPVLIMCGDDDVQNWQEQFQKWTVYTDIAIKQSNPFTSNRIHINTAQEAGVLARRSWAIVVVQDSTFTKDKFQMQVYADFKLWITSVDMKTNLPVFSSIYEWLHPNSKVNFEDIIPSRPDDIITKYILLDAFFEDIVLRRHDFWTPYMKPVVKPKQDEIEIESPPKSRKNKDPTGTKVKRSKRNKIDSDDDNPIPNLPLLNKGSNHPKIPGTNKESNYPDIILQNNNTTTTSIIYNNASKTSQDDAKNNTNDVENFIRDHNTIDSEQFKECNVNEISDSLNTQSNTFNEIQDAINQIIDNENRSEPNVIENSNDIVVNNYRQTTDIVNFTTQKSPDMFTEETNTNSFSITTLDTTKTHEIKNINTTGETDDSIENFNEDKNVDVKGSPESQFLEEKVKMELKNEENNAIDDVTPNVSTKSDTPKVSEKSKFEKDFDAQFAEYEDKIMKKFKGSFLDKLF